MAAFVVGCSTAPSASPDLAASTEPTASALASPSAEPSIPTAELSASPNASPTVAPSSEPPATPDPKYLGSFAVLPASPPAGFRADIECTGAIGASDPVAYVVLQGESRGTLRDYADVNNPRTACTFKHVGLVQIIDPRHVVAAGGNRFYAVVDLPRVRYHWFRLPQTDNLSGPQLIAVGRDRDRVVWKDVFHNGERVDAIYVSTEGRTRILATLPDTNPGRCGEPWDSSLGGYTTSGDYLYVLNQPMEINHSLVIFKGQQSVFSSVPPHTEWATGNAPNMAIWSPVQPALYWEQRGDVWRWTPDGGKQKFLDGVSWFLPTISADGHYVAYVTNTSNRVFLLDLFAGGPPREIGQPGGEPRFVNATQLWYRAEASVPGCTGPQPPRERIYDVSNGTEAGSIIQYVNLTWPATSAHY
jgi:hypothetical protein